MDSNVSARFEELLVERLRAVLADSGNDPQNMAVYIQRMLANNHSPDHMAVELQDFMGAEAVPFVQWICSTLESLSSAQDGNALVDSLDVEMQNLQQEQQPDSRSREQEFDLRSQLDASDRKKRDRQRDYRARSTSPATMNGRGRRQRNSSFNRDGPSSSGTHRQNRRVTRSGNGGPVVVTIQSRSVSSHGKSKSKSSEQMFDIQRPERINMRCSYWPNCRNTDDACPYVHPTEPCRFFPHCTNPATCIYVHPTLPCKFQGRCLNPTCNYQHVTAPAVLTNPNNALVDANPTSTMSSAVVCRFHPDCKNSTCAFFHPPPVECRFGLSCTRPNCHFAHPPGHVLPQRSWVNAPCRFGSQCTRPDCPYQHDVTKTMDDAPMTEE